MDKNEVAGIGFEIVAYSGDARSKFLRAIKNAKEKGDKSVTEQLIKQGEELLVKAHKAQTELLVKESLGEEIELGFIFVHGQDHLMTTILLKDIITNLLDIYE